MRYLGIAALAVLAGMGCEAPCSSAGLGSLKASWVDEQGDSAPGSLFITDQQGISNALLGSILQTEVALPPSCRVALMELNRDDHTWWSPQEASLGFQAIEATTDLLESSARVEKVVRVPSLLIPKQRSISDIRVVAARCQADVAVLYFVSSRSYQKHRFLADSVVKAYCQVDAVVLDVRTGLIPYSTVALRDYTAEKSRNEIEFEETVQAARMKAQADALGQIAREVVQFLDSVPVRESAARTASSRPS